MCSVMISIYNRVCAKLLGCVVTHSGLGGLIMPASTILDHMNQGSSVNEVIMIATMVAFSSNGMPRR